MKRTVIGGFLSLIGTLLVAALLFCIGDNLVDGYTTPPGRFWSTVFELDLTLPLILSVLLLLLGLVVLGIEYFKKDAS